MSWTRVRVPYSAPESVFVSRREGQRVTEKKCAEILAFIVKTCNENMDFKGGGVPVIGFGPDWGGNSLTMYTKGTHTHVGSVAEESDFATLIDQLHDRLINGRGLSWA